MLPRPIPMLKSTILLRHLYAPFTILDVTQCIAGLLLISDILAPSRPVYPHIQCAVVPILIDDVFDAGMRHISMIPNPGRLRRELAAHVDAREVITAAPGPLARLGSHELPHFEVWRAAGKEQWSDFHRWAKVLRTARPLITSERSRR